MNTLRNLIIAIVAFIPMLTAAQTEETYRELTCDEMQERIDCLQREKSKNNIQLAGICNWWNDTILEYTVEFLENIDKKYRAGLYEEPSALMAEDGCKDILFEYSKKYRFPAADLTDFIGNIANTDSLKGGMGFNDIVIYPKYIKGYLDAYKKYKKYITSKDLNFYEIIDDMYLRILYVGDNTKGDKYFNLLLKSDDKYFDSLQAMQNYFFEALRKEIAEDEAKQNSPGTPPPHEQ